jgi:hypothetical protein
LIPSCPGPIVGRVDDRKTGTASSFQRWDDTVPNNVPFPEEHLVKEEGGVLRNGVPFVIAFPVNIDYEQGCFAYIESLNLLLVSARLLEWPSAIVPGRE